MKTPSPLPLEAVVVSLAVVASMALMASMPPVLCAALAVAAAASWCRWLERHPEP